MLPAARRIAAANALDHAANHAALAEARLACLPHAAAQVARVEGPASMCMGIGGWSCADCAGVACSCDCHKEAA